MEDKAEAMTEQGRTKLIAGQRGIGRRISRRHVGGRGTRHRAGTTTRTGPELNPEQRQHCANKSQGRAIPRAGWRAQQAKQGAEWEATQNDLCCRIIAGQGNGVSDDMMEGRARAGRKARKGRKRVDRRCQDKVEGEDEWCVRERRAGQGRAGQGRAG